MKQAMRKESQVKLGVELPSYRTGKTALYKFRFGKEKWYNNFMEKWDGSEFHTRICMDKFEYQNNQTKGTFICSHHGEFRATPGNIMARGGCPECVNKTITTEQFIKRAKKIHGNKYLYGNTVYNGMNNDITITCRLHGDFKVRAANHTHPIMGSTEDQKYYSGCQKCSKSWRFKKPDKKKLETQLLKESLYNLRRSEFTMEEIPNIKLLLNELITTGLYMVNYKDTKGSGGIKLNLISKCSSKLIAVAIDVVTEKEAVNEQFLEAVAEITLKHIAYMATKFEYTGVNASYKTDRLDKVKEPAWKLIDACRGRLDNGNKQLCQTRKSASAFL